MYDLILRNGFIIDGSGAEGFHGDVGVRKGTIEHVGGPLGAKGEREIDVEGQIIAPGFIDVSNHSDTHLTLFTEPRLTGLTRQGITTVIGGNCGTSLAPLISGEAIQAIRRWVPMNQINVNWLTTDEYHEELKRRSLRVNYGTLVGYLTIRRGLLGDEFRPVTDEERDALLGMLQEAFEEGALGVSFGLAYSHLYMADTTELEAVARLAADYDRILTVHMRNEGQGILDSVKEVVDIARQTGVRTEISHLKILGEKNWDLFDQVIEVLNHAIYEEELPIAFDIFPYQANNGVLYLQLPYWVTKNGKEAMLQRLRDPETADKVVAEMKRNSEDFSRMVISSAPHNERLIGKTIQEVANNQEVSLERAIINLLIATNSQITTLNYAIKPQQMVQFAAHEAAIVGTDGVGHDESMFTERTYIHPRSVGAMARFWSLDEVDLSAEEKIHRMTGRAAEHFRLADRGWVRKGYRADLVVFAGESFRSQATLDDPFHYAQGLSWVFVNGRAIIHDDEEQEGFFGELLTR